MSPPGFKARVGSLIQTFCRGICVICSLSSGATPADLLAASMAAEKISSTYMQRH